MRTDNRRGRTNAIRTDKDKYLPQFLPLINHFLPLISYSPIYPNTALNRKEDYTTNRLIHTVNTIWIWSIDGGKYGAIQRFLAKARNASFLFR